MAPGAPPSPERWSRDEAIGRLRECLLKLTDAEHSMCQVAAELKIFCRGFCRWDETELRRRWQKVLGKNSGLTRAQLEELANLWQLTEQVAQRVALACDAQRSAHGVCRGWDDFSNDEIARYCSDLLGSNVVIVEDR
ncbi:MAG: hypothetical protein ACRD1P_02225 [Thermoanaerobaculia bacterium]